MPQRQCDQATIVRNQDAAKARSPRRDFHPIPNVVITSVQGTSVKLSVIASSSIGTAGSRKEVGPVTWGDEEIMWAYCPSSLPSAARDPVTRTDLSQPPDLFASGTLLLEGKYCRDNDIALTPGSRAAMPKWPRNLGFEPFPSARLRLKLTELQLDGILLTGAGSRAESLNLLDQRLVSEQTIEIGDGTLELRLTEPGFQALDMPIAPSRVAMFAPTHLMLTGTELEDDGHREATLDLMDLVFAPRRQEIRLNGGPTHARLTQAGFIEFIVPFSP